MIIIQFGKLVIYYRLWLYINIKLFHSPACTIYSKMYFNFLFTIYWTC